MESLDTIKSAVDLTDELEEEHRMFREEQYMCNKDNLRKKNIALLLDVNNLKRELEDLKVKSMEDNMHKDLEIEFLRKELDLTKVKRDDLSLDITQKEQKIKLLQENLDRISRKNETLQTDYYEAKKVKDDALNRLSALAGDMLRNNNPNIADLSDKNRPINLGEKFSQLYDDPWTDAMEKLEEMGYSEEDGIQILLEILREIFNKCAKLSKDNYDKLKKLTGTSDLPDEQLKRLKDFRKSTVIHMIPKIKDRVNKYMIEKSCVSDKEKDICQNYIDRATELCWMMAVQDPPVVIDFDCIEFDEEIEEKVFRKFTRAGNLAEYLVWPPIRLHQGGPLLQKGVVQPQEKKEC